MGAATPTTGSTTSAPRSAELFFRRRFCRRSRRSSSRRGRRFRCRSRLLLRLCRRHRRLQRHHDLRLLLLVLDRQPERLLLLGLGHDGKPLLFAGQSIGTLNVYTSRPYNFSNEEIKILSALAELSAIAIEKARLYERIVDVEEQLRQNEKLSALGLLAAEVAHEIRNPLTVMKLLYHSLDLKFPASDPRAKDTRIIEEKIEHLNRIVEQILNFARTTEPKLAPVNLNELVDELGLLVRHKLANQNVRLIRELQSDLPLVMGDAPQLEQAFLNLILNAAEAMPGGGTLTIRSHELRMPSTSAQPAQVIMEFKDTGKGMSAELQKRAFTSVLSTTKAKGTGLGLAIVGRIIETHRGDICIKSKIGRGTSIIIRLPAQ